MRCSMPGTRARSALVVSLSSSLMMLLLFAVSTVSACPASCSCKWKNGKQTVECINKDLLVIPEGMDSGTQVLEFCGNNLQTLHKDKFLRMDLINLQRIYLCRCRIASIDDRTFKGLTNLVELDLSGNLLESVPAFLECPSLMRLTLSSNPIKTLRRAGFAQLAFLSSLELANCVIANVEEGAFQGLYSLEWLHLNGNRMTALYTYLPESLKGVQLQENPWECDCHVLELHAWLLAFSLPHSVEPVCNGPVRLRGRTIKSVPSAELACLPEVSPTTFYLEIGEGRNVSLLCQVHAVPQARISWRFQGQLLQNDSIVAPGVHLIYYIEEGSVEKRSELFIYNANTDDNGTFMCNAENPAGMSQANFTIRIVVKHETAYEPNELPFEFILVTVVAAAVSLFLFLLVLVLSLIKCHRNARLRRKRNRSKVALSHSTKDNLLDETTTTADDKEGSSIKLVSSQEEETMGLYAAHPSEELLEIMSSPGRFVAAEQNPDLINGTETVTQLYHTPMKQQRYHYHPGNEMYVLAPDVRLNPGLLPAEARFGGTCYKTLPYKPKRQASAANPLGRYSREAEFLSRSAHPASYEHYGDVRYTADGYPARNAEAYPTTSSSSPVESHKSDGAVEPCCSTAKVNWPSCMPANLLLNNKDNTTSTTARSVVAQTQTDNVTTVSKVMAPPPVVIKPVSNKLLTSLVKVHETLTESPDEGYEGDGADNNSCQTKI